MEYLLLIILTVLFIYLSWRKTLWGIAGVLVLLPTYLWRFNFFGLPTTFLEILVISLFVVWLWKGKNYKRINFSFTSQSINMVPLFLRILLVAWVIISVVAVIVNPEWTTLGMWRAYFLEPILFFIVVLYEVKDSRDLKIIFNALAAMMVLLFIWVVVQQVTSWGLPAAYDFPNHRRLTGPFSYPNALALLTAPVASLFAGLWIQSKKKSENWFYIVIFLLGLIMCLLSVSQGALAGLLATLFIWLMLEKKIRKVGIPVVVLVIVGSLFFAPTQKFFGSIRQQIFNPILDLSATSLEIRSSQWSETWAMLSDRWLLGAGLKGYQSAVEPYHTVSWLEIYLYPHNIFLNFWSELGLLGLIIFLLLIAYIFVKTGSLIRRNNFLGWPLTMFWLTWLVHGLVDVPYFKNDLSILFFIGLAVTILADKAIERNANV